MQTLNYSIHYHTIYATITKFKHSEKIILHKFTHKTNQIINSKSYVHLLSVITLRSCRITDRQKKFAKLQLSRCHFD